MRNASYFESLREVNIDVDGTLMRFVDNEELFIKFLKKFFGQTDMAELGDKLEAKDYEGVLLVAHTWKGVTGNLGILDLYETYSDMVNDLRRQDYTKIEESFQHAKEQFEALKAVVLA